VDGHAGQGAGPVSADVDIDDDEPCTHDCDDECWDDCLHEHCFSCGGCGCPGYCDDYQTYNLRPEETGGEAVSR
jgi:hypothetical protein